MMYYYDSLFPFNMFNFGFVFMLLFWGFIIYGAVLLFKRTILPDEKNGRGRAIEILKERYAKGDITKEQFEIMKKDLE